MFAPLGTRFLRAAAQEAAAFCTRELVFFRRIRLHRTNSSRQQEGGMVVRVPTRVGSIATAKAARGTPARDVRRVPFGCPVDFLSICDRRMQPLINIVTKFYPCPNTIQDVDSCAFDFNWQPRSRASKRGTRRNGAWRCPALPQVRRSIAAPVSQTPHLSKKKPFPPQFSRLLPPLTLPLLEALLHACRNARILLTPS